MNLVQIERKAYERSLVVRVGYAALPSFPNAACTDEPDAMFPNPQDDEAVRQALEICHTCPHETECGLFAIKAKMYFGVWGGMTERTRRRIARQGRI